MKKRLAAGVLAVFIAVTPAMAQETPEPGPAMDRLAEWVEERPVQIAVAGTLAMVLTAGGWVLLGQLDKNGETDGRSCFLCGGGGFGLVHETRINPGSPTTTTTTTTTTNSTSSTH